MCEYMMTHYDWVMCVHMFVGLVDSLASLQHLVLSQVNWNQERLIHAIKTREECTSQNNADVECFEHTTTNQSWNEWQTIMTIMDNVDVDV